MYIRKTKDIYILFWNGEEIDEAETRADALYLKQEYNIAYRGGVTIKKRRVKK
jgi:hypothetical protein